MKSSIKSLTLFLAVCLSSMTFISQEYKDSNSSTNVYEKAKYINFGIGANSFGFPFTLNAEVPIMFKNQSIHLGASYAIDQDNLEFGEDGSWNRSMIGFHSGWNYNLDELIADLTNDFLPKELSIYSGGRLEYNLIRAKHKDGDVYYGEQSRRSWNSDSGIDFVFVEGARYHLKDKENFVFNLEFGTGFKMSFIKVGVSLVL